jgi:hypothetical protein
MSNTTIKKIENVETEIKQLQNRKKLLLQKQKAEERKSRTHRLCKRGGYLESKIPELVKMTDYEFYSLVDNQLLPWYAENKNV